MTERGQRVRAPKPLDDIPKIKVVGQAPDLFGDFYHSVLSRSWLRHLSIACGIFLGANALFALLYLLDPGCIANAEAGSFADAFFFSVQTMSTIGYGAMTPVTRFANILVTFEALFGTLLVAGLTGVTFAKLARPTAKVLFTRWLVIQPRDGVPHLMVRMANWRHNNVVEARLRMFTLRMERTREGDTIRVPVELELVRNQTAVFWMSWTAMHRIDERSPLYGPDALDRLRAEGSEIFLIFTGIDDTFSAAIHARHRYQIDDIVAGARFADILKVLPDGTRLIDYHKFHEVVMIDGSEGPRAPARE
ncbi:MAG: ATP-sensitive inward rectifier potassium channel 10 [Myxococcales bacterium]|nr:ATP-sensitive inward rectifier potassium channel 10 [Myxococcales bacterium]